MSEPSKTASGTFSKKKAKTKKATKPGTGEQNAI